MAIVGPAPRSGEIDRTSAAASRAGRVMRTSYIDALRPRRGLCPAAAQARVPGGDRRVILPRSLKGSLMRRLLPVCAAALLAIPSIARAQECRDQTPAEAQVIARALDTIRKVVEAPLLAGDWQIERTRSGEKAPIAIHPGPPRPLMTCMAFYSVDFVLKPDTPRGAAHYAKQKAAMDAVSDPKGAAVGVLAHELNLGQLSIAVGENMPYVREEIHDPLVRMTVPGVPLAYRVTPPPKDDHPDNF